jgi:hypothetical protein
MLLDEIMPEFQFDEVHRVRVDALPGRTLEAVRQATPGEMPLVRLLFRIRSLPAILTKGRGLPTARSEPLFGQLMDSGFVSLREEPGREMVAGVVGQPWKLGGSLLTIKDACEFVAFERPAYMKAALNFFVEPEGGRTELSTETRVLITDTASRRRFGYYWKTIRPGSAVIRRSWLWAAKRRAERYPSS